MRRERHHTPRMYHRRRTRHHSATPSAYSHHHAHVIHTIRPLFFRTRPFRTRATTRGTETRPRRPLRPRHNQGPPPGRARPTGRRPGAPRGSRRRRTHLGRTGPPGGPYGSARACALRPRAAVPSAAAGARSAPSTPPTPPRAAPSSAAAAVAVPAAQSRCTCVHGAVTDGQSEHDGLSGAEFEALWRPRTFRSARDPPLEVPARWARHPEGRETRPRPPCRPTGWAGGTAGDAGGRARNSSSRRGSNTTGVDVRRVGPLAAGWPCRPP